MTSSCFAVFIVAKTKSGLYAATTRAADRGESGKIGLPGGKIDSGEHPVDAAMREAKEEGWLIVLPRTSTPRHTALVEGKMVWWYVAKSTAAMLTNHKEAGRIFPVEVQLQDLIVSGYGNEWLKNL